MHTTTKAEGRISVVGIIRQVMEDLANRRNARRRIAERRAQASVKVEVEAKPVLDLTGGTYDPEMKAYRKLKDEEWKERERQAIVAGEQERSRREAELHQEIMREEAEFLKQWAAEGYWQADEDGTPPEFYSSDLRAARYEEAFLREHPEEAMVDCQDNDNGWRQTCEQAGEFYDPDPGIVAEHIINGSDGDEEITDRLTAVGPR